MTAFRFPSSFDPQPVLFNDAVELRPLTIADRDGLTEAAGDPDIWAGHPVRDRYKPEVFRGYFDFLESLGSAMTIRAAGSGRIIGCSAFYTDTNAPARLSIGFTFLTRDQWGGQTNRQAKSLMLGHIFRGHDEAWFHIAPSNIRSQVATGRLGAVFTHQSEIDLGTGAQPWRCYCLTKEAWNALS